MVKKLVQKSMNKLYDLLLSIFFSIYQALGNREEFSKIIRLLEIIVS